MARLRWMLAILVLLSLFVGCKPAPTPTPVREIIVVTATSAPATPVPTTPPTSVPPAAAQTANLEIVGLSARKVLSLDELKALPATEGWAGIKSSTGKITPPSRYKGVSIEELCKQVGAFDASLAANVVAKDGYAMTFSYDQVTNGPFTTFDPATGDEVKRDEKLTLIVAYEKDGQPIPEESDGSLRLAIVGPEKNQVTDGHWAVKWVRQLVIKPAAAEWTLHLEGVLVEDMDRATFESGSAPNCHLAEWADDQGDVWGGIPLYFLLGRVDDQNKHESGAFNYDLAQQGYKVDVVAADGYKVTFDSQALARNKTIILAHQVNGEPLPEKYFPLRLVGSGLKKNEMVGAVAQIVLHLDQTTAAASPTAAPETTPSPKPTSAPPEAKAGTLHIYGAVTKDIAFTQAQLEQIGLVKITAEHPKKGKTDYEGVRLKDLLQQVQPKADATKAILTAGDGYTSEVQLAALNACADCLVTIQDGTFSLVMPGMESSAWVKDVRVIEIK